MPHPPEMPAPPPWSTSPAQHKANTCALFDRLAPGYDDASQRFFIFAADRLAACMRPTPGEKVLDVATGTGHVATAAAQAVAGGNRGGRVQAIDLSPVMLEQAVANTRRLGLTNVDFQLMDGEALEFKSGYFDVATCGFGLFFLSNMDAALRQWHRVLKPGGRVGFSSFGATAFQPLGQRFEERLTHYGIAPAAFIAQRLIDPGVCKALLAAAGFVDIEVRTMQLGYHLHSEQDWWNIVWNTGFRARLEPLSPVQLATFRATHLEEVRTLATGDGIWLDVATLITTGCRPAD